MRCLEALDVVHLFYTVIDSMKAVLKKIKGSDLLEDIDDEPVMESSPLARGGSVLTMKTCRRIEMVISKC